MKKKKFLKIKIKNFGNHSWGGKSWASAVLFSGICFSKICDGVVHPEGFRHFLSLFFIVPCLMSAKVNIFDRKLIEFCLAFDGDSDSAFQEGRILIYTGTTGGSVVLCGWLQAAPLLARALKLRGFSPC